ncbi:hypothetical protein HF520_09070 [Romboutsia sp. CE17]|uniref:hypothetical protein n=1 Tax=Romboutsia sp. CE17 TaxID=2724150 RepID=UPI001442E126|nr:hypothetical protein [Romboutsia sp. CE17]QJA09090.1 hypothetical protein HF520_09070 [Romboutsia sp. CE17]
MSTTLYYGKINLNSDHIFKVYEKPELLKETLLKLKNSIKNGVVYKYTQIYKGEEVKINHYVFSDVDKLDDGIYGKVVKKAPIFANQTDENGKLKKIAVDNEEIISFYFDVEREIVAFYTTNRFGYSEFCKAFASLITKSINEEYTQEVFGFEVSLINNNLNMKEIESSLKELGALEEITIDIIPPNPDEELLNELEKNMDKIRLKDYKTGNVTGRRSSLKSTSSTGLVVDSEIVKQELASVYNICPEITAEDAIKKGYATIEAKNTDGRTFSTNDKKPIKDIISDEVVNDKEEYCKTCKYKIGTLPL